MKVCPRILDKLIPKDRKLYCTFEVSAGDQKEGSSNMLSYVWFPITYHCAHKRFVTSKFVFISSTLMRF